MSAPNVISPEKLMKLVGTSFAPIIIDVRTDEDFNEDPRLIPSSFRRNHVDVEAWAPAFAGKSVVASCHHGAKISHGAAAWLRYVRAEAVSLEGGYGGWKAAGLPLIPMEKLPPRGTDGRTLWVTRARPKIDRIACPWLIRRFVDSSAVFLFVAASEVDGVASRFGATPFDIEGTYWSHRGETCTFDVMIEELGLATPPLLHLAKIIRAADTARLDLAPEASGLLAASLGLSRIYSDDLAQLDAGMTLYDAFYRWCRDATDETHNWPSNKVKP
jgi:rhodanese-related sulfurtransferase